MLGVEVDGWLQEEAKPCLCSDTGAARRLWVAKWSWSGDGVLKTKEE
jgi:hypothetical protein